MNTKAVALLAGGLVAAAGVGTAVGDLGDDDVRERTPQELEVRKDDGFDDVELVDEEEDRDPKTRDGDQSHDRSAPDEPTQDPQTGSGDNTGGTGDSKGTGWTGDTFDGDWTDGNDGTGGGVNSYVAEADTYAAPAPAPAPAYHGGDDGGSYGGGGSDG